MVIEFGKYYPPEILDSSAKNEFIKVNLALILQVARTGPDIGITVSEALSLCYEAFWKAYLKFDPSFGDGNGNTFIAYVRQAMRTELNLERRKANKMNKVIAMSLDSVDPVNDYPEFGDDNFNGENYCCNISTDKDAWEDQDLLRLERADLLEKVMSELADDERKIIYLYTQKNMTQQDIANQIGITQPAVSIIIARAKKHAQRIIAKMNL